MPHYMSQLRHLSIGKIGRWVRTYLTRARAQPREVWILVAGLLAIGLIGSLTTYPPALLVALVVIVVLLADE